MSINKRSVGKLIAVTGVAFAGLSIIASKTKPASVYANEPEEKNPLEGKKVVFVENEDEPENADGAKGHLEVAGNSDYTESFYEKYVKRGFDIVLSFGGLVVLAPVLGAITLAIKIDDPGPALFTQKRLGKNKEYFKLHKFRSMKMNTPHDVPTHMLDNPDEYITRVGKFIRSHSLDELPQIWDIFVGNMSIVGPRPALWNQDVLTAERDKYDANDVKPGLTGLAQINGRDELELDRKAELDGVYTKKIGLGIDIKCFIDTFLAVFNKKGVREGGTGEMFIDNQPLELGIRKHSYSVLMSVYINDNSNYLQRALRSIYEDQIEKPDQIVVVFDGPLNDELKSVLDEFRYGKENIVKYIELGKNVGLGEALRLGTQECTGDYILRMDADDISCPLRFKRQIEFVENNLDVDAVGTDILEFNKSTNKANRLRQCPKDHQDIVEMGKHRNPMNHVTACIKRDALIECGGYESLLLLEDYYLWLRMIASGCKLANINEPLVYVRTENDFEEKRSSKERISGWKVLQDYMIHNDMISKKEAALNMIYINAFVKAPIGVKKVLYSKVLRK